MTYYMYVTLSEEDKIAMFIMDPDSGRLEHQWNMDVSGRPAPLATDPEKKYLYVGRYSLLMRGCPFFMLAFSTDLKRPCE